MTCYKIGENSSDWCLEASKGTKESIDHMGRPCCIFHAPNNSKGVSVSEFNKIVTKYAFKLSENNEVIDFSGTVFPSDLDFSVLGDKISSIKLDACEFSGDVRIANMQIAGDFSCMSSKLLGRIYAHNIAFNGNVNFGETQFIQEAFFSSCVFKKFASFPRCIFHNQVTFDLDTDFSKGASFFEVRFKSSAYFMNVIFGDTMLFQYAYAETKAHFQNVNTAYLKFMNANVQNFEFDDCKWPKKDNRYHIPAEDEESQQGKVETFYRRMKQKYKEAHDDWEASEWHVSEKELMRKRLKYKDSFLLGTIVNLYYFFSGYGERPVRACAIWLTLLGLVGCLLFISFFNDSGTISSSDQIVTIVLSWLQHLVFVKDVAFSPSGAAIQVILLLLTRVLIPVQTALMVFSFRNKLKR